MPKVPVHSKLAHLSEDQINALITRYYAGERIADLLAEYAVACHPPQLYKLFPPVIHSSVTCPNCGAVMMSARAARTSDSAGTKNLYCSQCRHKTSLRCNCEYLHIPAQNSHRFRLKTATSSNPNSAIDSNRIATTYFDMIALVRNEVFG